MMPDPENTLREYVQAFEMLNPEAILPFYHSPCIFIAPFGVSVAQDVEATRRTAFALIERARSQGYRRTEIRELHTRTLASNLVSLSGVFVRFRTDTGDAEIGRFGFSYIMRNDGTGWRIVVAVAHDTPPTKE